MSEQHLKMSDAFVHDSVEALERHIYAGHMSKHCCEYAAHAINSHDELVAEVERLSKQNKNMRDAINRMSKVIWGCQEDQDYFHDNVAMTREQFIEQYLCHPKLGDEGGAA